MAGQGQAQLPGLLSKYPHLREYLTAWQRSGRRPPVFAVQLSREMRDAEEVNVLYPIGDPFFVHVYSAEGPWRRYVVVQPRVEEGAWKALDYVDEAVAVRVLREGGRTEGEKEEVLRRLLEEVVASDPSVPRGEYRVVRKGGVVTEVRADPMLAAGIRHYVLMEKTAHGVIEPFIRDPYIEDISCDGVGPVFIVHKVFEGCVTNVSFRDERELDQFVLRLSIKCGRPVSFRNPIVDAQLPDGSRVNIVYGSDVSRRGSNFTIRKFSDTPISITQLIKWNVLSAEAAAYLWMLLESNMNVWFCGETASGKTTLLRAAAVFIRPTAKIVSIEDVPEIVVPHENWVSEVTKKGEAGTSGVELFDLLKAALRQRPNYIIVGEIRGQEASVAFQAMQCVEDAVVFAERGPVWLSELYAQHRSLGATDGDGSTYVEFPSPIGVYATAPGSREVWLAEAVGLRRLHSAETVRVTLSSGQVLRVTPNHRFILHPEGREVEASELLGLWRSGHRDLRLELRSPAGGGQMGPSSTALLPVGLGTFWYLVGRLIGGDYIASRGGRHELVSRVRGPGEAAELESIVNSVMACDGRSSARVRGSRTQLVFRGIRSELVHYLRSSGLLVSDGCRAWGALLSTDVGDGAALLKGILDALEGWGQRFQGPFGVVRASWTVWSLARLGLVEALRVRAGSEALGWGGLEGVLRASGVAHSVGSGRAVELRVDLEVEAELRGRGVTESLRYWRVPSGSLVRFVFEGWREGLNLRAFVEGPEAYCYPSGKFEWVNDVSPDGPAVVYDLVLRGASYYVGGTGPALPIMDTGHGVISTFHAGSVQKLIQRLVSDPINVPKTFIDNLNCVVLQSAVLHPVTRKLERRVISVNEILGVDPETEGMNYVEVFNWNPVYDTHEFRGEGTSYLLEEKIAKMRGIPRREIRRIYRELEMRARFLRRLIELGVFDYRDVFRAISLASSIGVERALEEASA